MIPSVSEKPSAKSSEIGPRGHLHRMGGAGVGQGDRRLLRQPMRADALVPMARRAMRGWR